MSYFGLVNDLTQAGTLTTLGQTVAIPLAGRNSAACVLTGTWTGTVIFEASADGVHWVQAWVGAGDGPSSIFGIPFPVNTATANGTYRFFKTTGMTQLRVRALSAMTGTANVLLTAVAAVPSHIYTNSAVVQAVNADASNSSNANLLAGGFFSGIGTTTLGVAGLQIALKADQNCTVYVDQSAGLINGVGTVTTNGTTTLNGVSTKFLSTFIPGDEIFVSGEAASRIVQSVTNDTQLVVTAAFATTASGLSYQYYPWDIQDAFNYFTNAPFGVTVQAVNAYYRFRVYNNNAAIATTFFRLSAFQCPVVDAVPRSLDPNGNFKVAIQSTQDLYGFDVENTIQGEMRVAEPYKLVGQQFDLNGNAGAVDGNFWNTSVDATGQHGSVTQANGAVTLNSGLNAAAFSKLWSVRRGRYVGGATQRFRANIQLGDSGTANNVRRWGVVYGSGMPTFTDGCWFQLDGTVFSLVLMKGGVATTINSGQFNGQAGITFVPNTDNQVYEIYWVNGKVIFALNDVVLHAFTAAAAPWAASLMLYVYLDNVNSATQGVNLTLNTRAAVIHRLGQADTSPAWKYIHGANAGTVLKYGPGRLKLVTLNTMVAGTTISIYDALSATNPIALIAPGTTSQYPGAPLTLNYALDFYTGLFAVTAGAGTDVTIVYE